MISLFAIAAGGAIGALLRHFVNTGAVHMWGTGFPWGILICNVLGSFLMGVLISWLAHVYEPPQAMKAFLAVGLLGAFTTFSTFSLDTIVLIERGAILHAGVYIVTSVVISIAALWGGMQIIRHVVS